MYMYSYLPAWRCVLEKYFPEVSKTARCRGTFLRPRENVFFFYTDRQLYGKSLMESRSENTRQSRSIYKHIPPEELNKYNLICIFIKAIQNRVCFAYRFKMFSGVVELLYFKTSTSPHY